MPVLESVMRMDVCGAAIDPQRLYVRVTSDEKVTMCQGELLGEGDFVAYPVDSATMIDDVVVDNVSTQIVEVSPPGFSGVVQKMKAKGIAASRAFALAWSMYRKGYKPRVQPEASPAGVKEYVPPAEYRKQVGEDVREAVALCGGGGGGGVEGLRNILEGTKRNAHMFKHAKHPKTGEEMYGPPPTGVAHAHWQTAIHAELNRLMGMRREGEPDSKVFNKLGGVNNRMGLAKANLRLHPYLIPQSVKQASESGPAELEDVADLLAEELMMPVSESSSPVSADEMWKAHKAVGDADDIRMDYAIKHHPGTKPASYGHRPVPDWKSADQDPAYKKHHATWLAAYTHARSLHAKIEAHYGDKLGGMWGSNRRDYHKDFHKRIGELEKSKAKKDLYAAHAPELKAVQDAHKNAPVLHPSQLKPYDIVYSNVFGNEGMHKVTRITHGGKRVLATPYPHGGAEVHLKPGSTSGYSASSGYRKHSPAMADRMVALHKKLHPEGTSESVAEAEMPSGKVQIWHRDADVRSSETPGTRYAEPYHKRGLAVRVAQSIAKHTKRDTAVAASDLNNGTHNVWVHGGGRIPLSWNAEAGTPAQKREHKKIMAAMHKAHPAEDPSTDIGSYHGPTTQHEFTGDEITHELSRHKYDPAVSKAMRAAIHAGTFSVAALKSHNDSLDQKSLHIEKVEKERGTDPESSRKWHARQSRVDVGRLPKGATVEHMRVPHQYADGPGSPYARPASFEKRVVLLHVPKASMTAEHHAYIKSLGFTDMSSGAAGALSDKVRYQGHMAPAK